MSSPKAIQYTVEQLAAMKEASDLTAAQSRLRVELSARDALAAECAAASTVYGVDIAVPAVPAANGRDSAAVRAQVDTVQKAMAETRAELVRVREDGRRELLLERLRAMPELVVPDEAPAASARATAVAEAAVDRAARYLSALMPGAELSDRFVSLIAALPAADGAAADRTATALAEEVGHANAAARRADRVRALIDDLDARAGALTDPAASVAVEQARRDIANVTDSAWASLRATVETAEEAERVAADQRYVADKIPQILAGLGFETVGGFQTLVPQNGVLVRRPGWSKHGVMFGVSGDEFTLDVVRTAPEYDPATTVAKNDEAEAEFCEVLPQILDEIAKEGVAFPKKPQILPPGSIAIPAIHAPDAVAEPDEAGGHEQEHDRRRGRRPQERAR